ncbi:MAG: glutathione S-transferase N-terminal domain-containing protein [Myxococcales bacterium]|nr:glutathione S-transferase N-terminal domain-containing protein [Myxococcales bacterium]
MWNSEKWPIQDPTKLQLFSLNTPNGIKASTMLEETGLPYEAHRVNILEDVQFRDDYKKLNPNSKIPALLDPTGADGQPLAIMESGAILIHLAEKSGKLMPRDARGRSECLQWLFMQVGHVGPMFGQFGHFYKYAKDKCDHPYPVERYANETRRLFGVLNMRLADHEFLAGEYSIADVATWPWVAGIRDHYAAFEYLGADEHTHLMRWLGQCEERPASQRGREVCPL